MADRQRVTREQRREIVERCLASGMTVKEWFELNKVSQSTMYSWMSRLRREEPDLFGDPTCGEWIELSRGSIAARTALAVRPDDEGPHVRSKAGDAHDKGAAASGQTLVVRLRNGVEVAVPDGTTEAYLTTVLRAVASL